MKRILFTISFLAIALLSCKKDDVPVYSGILTVNNKPSSDNLYAYGLHIPTGKIVKNTSSQEDVILVQPDFDVDFSVRKLFLTVNNFKASFSKFGEYGSEQAAVSAFESLKSFTVPSFTDIADIIAPNQVWLFRTADDRYAKIRIISTFSQKKDDMTIPYCECKLEWVFQPDGTATFN